MIGPRPDAVPNQKEIGRGTPRTSPDYRNDARPRNDAALRAWVADGMLRGVPHPRARELRWNMTEGERKLWRLLRRKQLAGYRFRRQATIGPFIADFFCPKARLIIELDGEPHSHAAQYARDEKRTRWLKAHGCRVIRFWNIDVFKRPDEVVDVICRVLAEGPLSSRLRRDTFPHKGGRGRVFELNPTA